MSRSLLTDSGSAQAPPVPETRPGPPDAAPRAGRVERVLQSLVLALAIGLPCGVLLAHLRIQPYRETRDVFVPLVASCLEDGVAWSFLAVALWGLVFRVLRGMSHSERLASLVTTVAIGVFPAFWYLYYVNVFHLPKLTAWPSLLGNLGMLTLGAALLVVVSRVLRTWYEGAWRPGPVGWLFGLLLAVVPVMAHLRGHAPREDGDVDVIVLVLDSLRADRLGCYGSETSVTPYLDRLARDSVLFEQAISASTLTKASVASLFTGLNPHHHGVYRGTLTDDHYPEILSEVLGEEHRTLAEVLHEEGFHTVGWVTNVQLHGYMGLAQGFSRYVDYAGWISTLRERFRRWREEWAYRQRYFAFLHFMDLRSPFVAPDQASDSAEERSAAYAVRLRYTDRWIGRILEDLRASGRYDDTLLVVTGDSGAGLDPEVEARRELGEPEPPYEPFVHVPLLVKLPGSLHGGRRVAAPVGLVDLYPTLLELLDLERPAGLDGRSLVPWIEGEENGEAPPVVIETKHAVALRTARWKYIRSGNDRRELYDLASDPQERDECAASHPEEVQRFERQVRRILQERRDRRRAGRVPVDPRAVGRLRAMGYL